MRGLGSDVSVVVGGNDVFAVRDLIGVRGLGSDVSVVVGGNDVFFNDHKNHLLNKRKIEIISRNNNDNQTILKHKNLLPGVYVCI